MGRHALRLLRLLLPASSDCLPLRVELNCALAVEVRDAPHASLVSSEREHGKRNGNGQIDSNLSSFNLGLVLSRGMSVLCEDS